MAERMLKKVLLAPERGTEVAELFPEREQRAVEAEKPAQPKGHGTWRSTNHRIWQLADTGAATSDSR